MGSDLVTRSRRGICGEMPICRQKVEDQHRGVLEGMPWDGFDVSEHGAYGVGGGEKHYIFAFTIYILCFKAIRGRRAPISRPPPPLNCFTPC